MVHEAVLAVEAGLASVVVVAAADAGVYIDHGSTAPWTRPENEFVAPWGLFTAAEFALIARRHMEVYGTTREQLAMVAATIRNNGHLNPEAVYFGRGPFKPDDVIASRLVADPFHLLDCSMTSEGGCALVVAAPTWSLDRVAPGVRARRRRRPLRPRLPVPAELGPRRPPRRSGERPGRRARGRQRVPERGP